MPQPVPEPELKASQNETPEPTLEAKPSQTQPAAEAKTSQSKPAAAKPDHNPSGRRRTLAGKCVNDFGYNPKSARELRQLNRPILQVYHV